MLKFWALLSFSVLLSTAFAGPKEDFVETAKKSCGKSQADAEALATPGRTGNVIKWQQCTSGSIDIDGCNMPCSNASSKIGN